MHTYVVSCKKWSYEWGGWECSEEDKSSEFEKKHSWLSARLCLVLSKLENTFKLKRRRYPDTYLLVHLKDSCRDERRCV